MMRNRMRNNMMRIGIKKYDGKNRMGKYDEKYNGKI